MQITIIMVVTYILCCARIATAPWRYWQINAQYFSPTEKIFSKLSLDNLIPEKWRLHQAIDSDNHLPPNYPVFLKPEWGQNAHGIHRIDDAAHLKRVRSTLVDKSQRFMLQDAAPGSREFEIFSIDTDRSDGVHDVFTITEAVNNSEPFPINSKYNKFTRYSDITAEFSPQEQTRIAGYLSQIGEFGISRMSVRADTLNELIAGDFMVIEINLFLPMPINLLDGSYTALEKWQFIRIAMMKLALATKNIKHTDTKHPIFASMMLYGRRKRTAVTHNIASAKKNTELGQRHIPS